MSSDLAAEQWKRFEPSTKVWPDGFQKKIEFLV
jgi:hypothetical protein